MKKSLGTEYTPEVHKAWITVFSAFFLRIFPLVPLAKNVLIPVTNESARLSALVASLAETNSKPKTITAVSHTH
jgi:hypothetical protein